ncbi:MAG: MFS transporter [Rhodospirillales bacterium]|nr:MFS transporter [Rhodospirillales bacterium]
MLQPKRYGATTIDAILGGPTGSSQIEAIVSMTGPTVPRAASPLRLLAQPDYLRLWTAGGLVSSMRWLEPFGVSFYVFELTGSPSAVAIIGFCFLAPLLLFGVALGSLAARYDRKTLMLTGLSIVATVQTTLAVLAFFEVIALWQIALGMFISGTFVTSEFPVRRTMAAEVAGPGRTGPAMALDQATHTGTMALGPVVGGLLIETVGFYGVYVLGAVFYGLAILLAVGVTYRPARVDYGGVRFRDIVRDGLRFAVSSRLMVAVLAVTVIVNFFATSFSSMIPVLGKESLGLTAFPIGLLSAGYGIASFFGAVAVSFVSLRYLGAVYFWGTVLLFLALFGLSGAPGFAAAFACLFAAGFGLAGFSAAQGALVLSAAPPTMRGPAFGIMTMFMGASPFGILHVGFLADYFGIAGAIAIVAFEGLVALAVIYARYPELYRPDTSA